MSNVLTIINQLNNSDSNIDKIIVENVNLILDSDDYNIGATLLESIDYCPKVAEYQTLIEAATELKDADREISKSGSEAKSENDYDKKAGLIHKMTLAFKKAVDWWYKVDPDKKHATLQVILKMAVRLIIIVASIIYTHKSGLTKNIADKLPVGYDGKNKILIKLFSRASIASGLVSSVVGQLVNLIFKADDWIEYKVNQRDIDKNIKELDDSIDKINDEIENCKDQLTRENLVKYKKNLENCLAKLTIMKEKFGKKSNKNNDNKEKKSDD